MCIGFSAYHPRASQELKTACFYKNSVSFFLDAIPRSSRKPSSGL